MTKTIEDHLVDFVNSVVELQNKNSLNENCKIEVNEGSKYYKLISVKENKVSGDVSSRGVYCFVEKSTGNIYKAANWKAPAKHVRGNIKNGLDGVTAYGAVYLR